MRIDFEERILRNPALGAVLTWRYVKSHFDVNGESPNLAHLSLAMPMALHRPTVRRVHRMNFGSGLLQAVASCIDITSDLQERTEQALPVVLSSVSLAAASGLVAVHRERGLPRFTPKRVRNVGALDQTDDSVTDMVSTMRRLGVWFAKMPIHEVAALLRVRF